MLEFLWGVKGWIYMQGSNVFICIRGRAVFRQRTPTAPVKHIYVYVVECNYIVTSDKIFSLMIDIVFIMSTWPNRRDGNEEGRGERQSKRRSWSSVRVVSKWFDLYYETIKSAWRDWINFVEPGWWSQSAWLVRNPAGGVHNISS